MIVSLDTYARRAAGGLTSWGNRYQTYTYARLATDGASPGVQQALTTIRQRVYPKAQAQNLSFAVQPVAGIGLSNHLWNEIAQTVLPPGMSITFVILALLIIAAAVFNYVNLSLARADQRSKEIGIRKSIGAQRKQLIAQFLSEAFCVTAGAMAVAILVMGAMLPWLIAATSCNLLERR
jgi:putative ABC transport system permease protein